MSPIQNRRKALVTGAAKRLGNVFALHLAGRGFDVGIHANTSVEEANAATAAVRAMGSRSVFTLADLRDEAAVARSVADTARALGGIDTLVLSASSFPSDQVDELDSVTFLDTLAVNAVGPFLFAKHALPFLKQNPLGRIIVLADVHADRPLRGFLAYSAAKAALVSITKSLAREWAPRIAVNAILPGSVLPPDDFDPAALEALRKRTPTGRLGTPSDLLSVLDFLVDAPAQITGLLIPVDGGRSLAP